MPYRNEAIEPDRLHPDPGSPARAWLARQLRWERRLSELHAQAGLLPQPDASRRFGIGAATAGPTRHAAGSERASGLSPTATPQGLEAPPQELGPAPIAEHLSIRTVEVSLINAATGRS